MPAIVEPPLPEARYTYGGDEFIFCEIAEAHELRRQLQGARDLPGARTAQASTGSSRSARPTPATSCASTPTSSRRPICSPSSRRSRRSLDTEHVELLDARDRRARLLRRSLDARGADALPRPSPGARGHRPRVRHAHQRLQDGAGVHRGPPRLALLRLDGRLRAGPALVLPDGRARAPARGAQVPARRAPTRRRSRSRTAAPSRPSTRCRAPAATSCSRCARCRSSTRRRSCRTSRTPS